MGVFDKIFGTRSQREIKKIQPTVDKILALEEEYRALSEEALKAKTAEFKNRLEQGETLDDLLPEAFAAVREAADRVLGMRPYPVQLIGGVVLYYLGMYGDCFTIHDFWQIRTSGWVGLGVVAAGSVWHLCKVCKRGVERRRTERAARQTEEAHRQALESARREAYEAGKADAAKERQPSPSTPETSAPELPLTPADAVSPECAAAPAADAPQSSTGGTGQAL